MAIFGEREKTPYYERQVNSATEIEEVGMETPLPDRNAVIDLVIDSLLDAGMLEDNEDMIAEAIQSLISKPMPILKEILLELSADLDIQLTETQTNSINNIITAEAPRTKPTQAIKRSRTPSINS